MSHAEAVIASRLLDEAARRFHEDSCTDTDPELFEGLGFEQICDLVEDYNAWYSDNNPGHDGYIFKVSEIQIDQWMEFCAWAIGRTPEVPA